LHQLFEIAFAEPAEPRREIGHATLPPTQEPCFSQGLPFELLTRARRAASPRSDVARMSGAPRENRADLFGAAHQAACSL
jgi:hypothetical protein